MIPAPVFYALTVVPIAIVLGLIVGRWVRRKLDARARVRRRLGE